MEKHLCFVFPWADIFAGSRILTGIVFQLLKRPFPCRGLGSLISVVSPAHLVIVLLKIMYLFFFFIRMIFPSFGFMTVLI